MKSELINKEDVLNLLYSFKDDDRVPKNYGTLLDIIRFIRVMPGVTENNIHELKDRDTAKRPDIEGDGYDEFGDIFYDTWICPNCNQHYEIYDDYVFCPVCGQRIDRSEL